jgi:hypothetical protein
MLQLGFVSFAEDQGGLAVPMKPDRSRLRRALRIDGGEPDDLLLAEATVYTPSEFAAEV